MQTIVIGAGIVGLTTAWELANRGHHVTVFEAQDGVALGSSFANGGQLSFSYVDPFAAPGLLHQIPSIIKGNNSGISIRLRPGNLAWSMNMLRNSSRVRFRHSLSSLLCLAELSSSRTEKLLSDIHVKNIANRSGKMVIYPTTAALEEYRPIFELKKSLNADVRMLTRDECIATEPALAPQADTIGGGIYSPGDFAADSHEVGKAIAKYIEDNSRITLKLESPVSEVLESNGRASGVISRGEQFRAESIVLCAGEASNTLAKPLGIRLGIEPIYGFSLTAPALDKAPRTSITFINERMVVSTLNGNLRVAGHAHVGPISDSAIRSGQEHLLGDAKKIFPGAADYNNRTQFWCGGRPARANSIPLVSESSVEGLYLNTGHGAYGWTLAGGSAQLIADIIEQKPGRIDRNPYRY